MMEMNAVLNRLLAKSPDSRRRNLHLRRCDTHDHHLVAPLAGSTPPVSFPRNGQRCSALLFRPRCFRPWAS